MLLIMIIVLKRRSFYHMLVRLKFKNRTRPEHVSTQRVTIKTIDIQGISENKFEYFQLLDIV